MAYIGSAPTANTSQFSSIYTQSFNGTGSATSFTLNRAVASVNNIEVVVNNVQQSPFDGSYTVTGLTTLLFSEAPSSGTNNIYVIYRDQPIQSITDTGAVRKTGDTMTGALTLGGLLDTGSTGQIKFPATQSASSDANTLDDYEEGTWTPTFDSDVAGTGRSTAVTYAKYTKVGRLVTVEFAATITVLGSGGSGAWVINGLPFPTANQGAFAISYSNALAASLYGLAGEGSGSRIVMRYQSAAGTSVFGNNAPFSSYVTTNTSLSGTLTYMTA